MAQQEEKLKRLESLNALTETNKMLKEEKNRLEQELQQNRAKARTQAQFIKFVEYFFLDVIVYVMHHSKSSRN